MFRVTKEVIVLRVSGYLGSFVFLTTERSEVVPSFRVVWEKKTFATIPPLNGCEATLTLSLLSTERSKVVPYFRAVWVKKIFATIPLSMVAKQPLLCRLGCPPFPCFLY